ncbi:MAG: universal stress protein [Ekhidna sp.]|nr:universal stress protein [Ekhidna sp.]MBC6408941.1 universal stress protein [Ekhidna sp.]MBC6427369.1 universal stress protein [Ekhidna sp.]
MIDQILISTDFSPAAWKATKIGMELAQTNNAELNILHIIPTVSRFSDDKRLRHLPENPEEVKRRMNEISKGLVEENRLTIQNFVLPGNVAQTMLNFIGDNSYDLVILGVNSRGTGNDLGSHATLIIEKCSVPVLIVPNNTKSNGAIAS